MRAANALFLKTKGRLHYKSIKLRVNVYFMGTANSLDTVWVNKFSLHLKQIRTLKSLGCDNHLFDFQQKHCKWHEHSIRAIICLPLQCVFSSSFSSCNFVHQIECSSLLQYLNFNHFFSANSFHIEHIREWRMTFKIRIQILVVRFGANDTRSYRKKNIS